MIGLGWITDMGILGILATSECCGLKKMSLSLTKKRDSFSLSLEFE